MKVSYVMPWESIDETIDENVQIASPSVRNLNDWDNDDENAIEALDLATVPVKTDRRLQFADRFYTP